MSEALHYGWIYGQKHEAWLMGEVLHDENQFINKNVNN